MKSCNTGEKNRWYNSRVRKGKRFKSSKLLEGREGNTSLFSLNKGQSFPSILFFPRNKKPIPALPFIE
jgi:hypothetical protein